MLYTHTNIRIYEVPTNYFVFDDRFGRGKQLIGHFYTASHVRLDPTMLLEFSVRDLAIYRPHAGRV